MDYFTKQSAIDTNNDRPALYLKTYLERCNDIHLPFAFMYHAITRFQEDPDFKEKVFEQYVIEVDKHKKNKFLQVVPRYICMTSLTNEEKDKLQHNLYPEIYDYLINRAKKIGGYDKQIITMEWMKNNNIDGNITHELKEIQDKVLDYLLTCPVITQFMENPNVLQMKTIKNNKYSDKQTRGMKEGNYISIDGISANYSFLTYYLGEHLLGIPREYDEFTDYLKTITSNEFIINAKHMRGIVFGKLLKQAKMKGLYENNMRYFMHKIANFLNELGNKIMVVNMDEVIIEKGNTTVEQVKNVIKRLEPEVGPFVNRFRVEEYMLQKVVLPSGSTYFKKNDKVHFMTPDNALELLKS